MTRWLTRFLERKRDRYCTMEELGRIWRSLDDAPGNDPGPRIALRLQLLAGTRASDWSAALHDELHLDSDTRTC